MDESIAHGTREEPVIGPPPKEEVEAGHMPDKIKVLGILPVPLAVVFFFIVAFGATTVIFIVLMAPKTDTRLSPIATKLNSFPLNQRIERINNPAMIDQPRLEGVKLYDGDDQSFTKSSQPTKKGNYPEWHPEQLRPTAKYGQSLGLMSYQKNSPDMLEEGAKGTSYRIPVTKAIELVAAKNAKTAPTLPKILLPPEEGKAVDPVPSPRRAKLSNGGGQPLPGEQ